MQGTSSHRRLVDIRHSAVPGRVRLRVRGLYRSPRLAGIIRRGFGAQGDVQIASISTETGTVLLRCAEERDLQAVRDDLEVFVKDAIQRAARGDSGGEAQDDESDVWHAQDAGTAMQRLGAEARIGIDTTTLGERRQKFGLNRLPESEPPSPLRLFANQFASGPVALLAGSAVLSVATGGLADAALIVGVMLLNGAIGYSTESRAERVIRSLDRVDSDAATVLRDGALREISATELVPGDLILLAPGRIPADARLVEARHLTIDEAALTGESAPAKKSTEPLSLATPLADRHNMAYAGTIVTGGTGIGLVVATGPHSEIGRLQTLVGNLGPPETPLQRDLRRLGDHTVMVASLVCGTVFGIGLWRGMGALEILKTAVSLAIAAVPEGLPAIGTTTLAFGVTRMRERNVYVRRLQAVEGLGSVEVLCFDKTGTLTLNRMSVTRVYSGLREYRIRDGALLLEGASVSPLDQADLASLLRVGLLCNETRISRAGDGSLELEGSPTETALVRLAVDAGLDAAAEREARPLIRTKLRSESASYMATEHALATDGRYRLVAVKGRPDEVIRRSRYYLRDGVRKTLGPAQIRAFTKANEELAGKALRVLALAHRELRADDDYADDGLTLLGLVGLKDPPREGIKDLILAFHDAGIRTSMMTGDQMETASAIGRELNFNGFRSLTTVDARALEAMDAGSFDGAVRDAQIFARVSPTDKLRIVRSLQNGGRIVAMTGDGINDSPALKAADVGIAMGNGTQAARDAADVVLADDNLQTMLEAIRQGRSIRANLAKAVRFLLATNLSEILVTLGGVSLQGRSPLAPSHLLWINLLTDVFPALALALEPPERDVLKRPPPPPGSPLLSHAEMSRLAIEAAVIASGSLGAYISGCRRHGGAEERARSLAFLTLTAAQILHTDSARTNRRTIFAADMPPNPHVRTAITAAVAAQTLAVVVPGLRRLLGIGTLDRLDLAAIAAGSVLPLFINEAIKGTHFPSEKDSLP